MLSPPMRHSPRPRPPASARRTLPSPPPYDSPHPSTASYSSTWSNDSPHGLSERLVRADTLRRERENELDHTSFAYRSIYDNSVAIQKKHRSLLQRISSPPTSPTPSTLPLLPITLSLSTSPDDPPKPLSKSLYKRTLKVSHSDISKLYEDNAHLMQKIEELEAEQSHEAGQAGRSMRKLEEEISILRTELENTRAQKDELEHAAQEQEHALNRRIRDQTVQAARQKIRRDDWEIRDFAPANPYVTPRSSSVPNRLSLASRYPRTPSPPIPEQEQQEQQLIAQLLAKVNQLEETNAVIRAKHEQTLQRLRVVQREAENINLAYDALENPNDEFELELVSDDEDSIYSSTDVLPRLSPGHLHFRHLRKSIDLGSEASFDLEQDHSFDQGIRQAAQSTLLRHHQDSAAAADDNFLTDSLKHPLPNKLRPTVMGLFDGFDQPLSPPSACPSPSLSIQSFSTPGENMRTLESELGDAWDNSSRPSNHTLHSRHHSLYEMSIFGGSQPGSPKYQPCLILEPPTPDRSLEQQQQPDATHRQTRHQRAHTNSFSFKRRRFGEEWSKDSLVLRHTRKKSIQETVNAPASQTSKAGFSGFMVEFWLWLQFALIILVFVWTMARKGPREVLTEVDRNNGRRVAQ